MTDTNHDIIIRALAEARGVISEAAKTLGMPRKTLSDQINRDANLLAIKNDLVADRENEERNEEPTVVVTDGGKTVSFRQEDTDVKQFKSADEVLEELGYSPEDYETDRVAFSTTAKGRFIKNATFKKIKDVDKLKPFAKLIYAPKNYTVSPKLSRIKQERTGYKVALIETDAHCHPVHFDYELDTMVNLLGKKLAPDYSLGLGDDVHNDDFSRFPIEDVKLYSPLHKDVEIAREMTLGRVNSLPEGTKFVRIVGNHDEPRNNKKLIQMVGPANAKLLLKSWDQVLGYGDMGVEMILGDGGPNYPYAYYEINGMRFIHGHGQLENYLNRYGKTTVCGHEHTKEVITSRNQQNEVIFGYKVPSLARSDQGYHQNPKKHSQGFAVATLFDDGSNSLEYADWNPDTKILTFRGEQYKYNGS